MDEPGDVRLSESNEQEAWNVTEWEASEDESDASLSGYELAKRRLIAEWLKDFRVDDDDDDVYSDHDSIIINHDVGLADEDETDFHFGRRAKKKTETRESRKFNSGISELRQKGTMGGDARKEPSALSGGERPPSETVHFTSVNDMQLQTRVPSLVRSYTSEEEDTTERPKHYYIAREVLTSEITYVKGLHLVEKAFRGAIKTYNVLTKEIISDKEMRKIFLNLGEIYTLHQGLLVDLQKRLVKWDENPRIGDILVGRALYFKMYSIYSSEYEAAQATLAEKKQTCHELADIIERVELSPPSRAMPITSYMLTPIQRIPRYKLLLTKYFQNLPAGSPDLEDSKKALQAVSDAAAHMDELCKKLDNFQKVIKIQRMLIGNDTIVAPGRTFVAKGPVHCVEGKQLKPCIIFLFSDILVVTKVSRQGQYKILYQLQISGLKVQNVKTEVLPNTFSVIGMRLYRYQAKSEEEKIQWMKALRDTIKQCSEGRPVECLARTSTMMQDKKLRAEFAKVDEDVFTDGINGPSLLDTELALEAFCQISGYLRQKSSGSDLWCRRWFVVANLRIYSYQNHDDEDIIGFQLLSGCSVSLPDEDDCITRERVFKLTLHNGVTFFFQTDSRYDLDRWMGVLFVAGMAAEESAV